MLKSRSAVVLFVVAVVTSALTIFVMFDGKAVDRDLLPDAFDNLLRVAMVICWIGYFINAARDVIVAYLMQLDGRIDHNRRLSDDLYRRTDQLSLRLDRVNEHLKTISLAIEPYGEERETIGRLAAYREQLGGDHVGVQEDTVRLSQPTTAAAGGASTGATVSYLPRRPRTGAEGEN